MTFRLFICVQCAYRESIGGPPPKDPRTDIEHCPECGASGAFGLAMSRVEYEGGQLGGDPRVGMVPEERWLELKGGEA